MNVARQFQLTQEVHSLSITTNPDNSQYLAMNYWNTQSVDLYEVSGLLESPSDDITDGLLVKINVEDFAPFKALDLDQVHVFNLDGLSYLVVTLSNGYVLCFNLYPNALKASSAVIGSGEATVQIVRLSQVFKSGNIVESVSMPHPNAVLLTSDSQSFILSVDSSPKSGHFNDILVVPIR